MSPQSHSPVRRQWPSSKKHHLMRLDSGFRIYDNQTYKFFKKDVGKQKLEGEMIAGLKTSNWKENCGGTASGAQPSPSLASASTSLPLQTCLMAVMSHLLDEIMWRWKKCSAGSHLEVGMRARSSRGVTILLDDTFFRRVIAVNQLQHFHLCINH